MRLLKTHIATYLFGNKGHIHIAFCFRANVCFSKLGTQACNHCDYRKVNIYKHAFHAHIATWRL